MTQDYRQPEVSPHIKTKTSGTSSELSDLLCVNISLSRVDYIKRLICGIKKEAKKHMLENHKYTIEEYPESVCSHVADSLLLCSVLEQELFGITDA